MDLPVEKPTENVFLNPSHRSSHHKTHPHAHTPIPRATKQYHKTAPTLAWLSSLLLLAASHRGALLAPPASSVSYDGGSARYRCHFANNGYACSSFGGSRLSATPRTFVALAAFGQAQRHQPAWTWTRVHRARSTRCSRRTHEYTELFAYYCVPYSGIPSHQAPPQRA